MDAQKHVVCPHCGGINRLPAERLAAGGRCGRCKQALFTGAPLDVDEAALQRHIARSDLPLLVDFWAPWCGPCKMMAPAFAQAARRLEPEVRLLKIDTERAQSAAARFSIRSIPTLVLFANGREIDRMSGALDAAGIERWALSVLTT